MKGSRKFYDRFFFLYPLADIFLMRQKRRMAREINLMDAGKLLEIGIGTGSHLPLYKNHQITAIDTSSAMLRQAAMNTSDRDVLLQMDAEKLSFPDNYFDYLVLSHVIAVVEQPETVLNEAFRVLRPGGRLFLLNHFTPSNSLRYVDQLIRPVAALFHLRSVFHETDLKGLKEFKLLDTKILGPFSYFKLLIYQKP